ncbi:MAG TPA: PIN domain-containing protein, partial [Beijerinckiaceae bacterium]|nr:PIN domain-containing protein [Beijerinckiaceae bacterium]
AAIHCGASLIVTANLRDFPTEILSSHGIKAQHPDAFILMCFKSSPREAVGALRKLRLSLKNPPMTPTVLLATMSRQGLSASADALGEYIDAL